MLQWMGGSRRKVTASRKSTQKRQQQYFEQRKRQQQQQLTAEPESYPDGTDTCRQRQNNSRSLDILSLLNLTSVGQERKSSCPAESLEGNISTLNYQTARCPPIQINEINPADTIELTQAIGRDVCMITMQSGTSAGCQVETECPRKEIRAFGSHSKALRNDDKVDLYKIGCMDHQLETTSERQLSVLDLLGDDGLTSNSEGNLVREAHVAFSVEGLGKVETETPVHSPNQPGRTFSYGYTSPAKARRVNSSKSHKRRLEDFESEVDAMILDIDMPFYGSSSGLPLHLRDMASSFSNPKQRLLSAKGFLQLNEHGNSLKNFYGDEEIFYDSEEKDEDIWDASSSFLDEEEYDLSSKNWPYQMTFSSADQLNIGYQEKPDLIFAGPHAHRKRASASETDRFNILDSPAPHSKLQISDDHEFTPDGTWYSKVGRNCGGRDATNQSAWSCFVTEDAGESLSFLSEESCSSSAVRGEATKKPPLDSMARQNTKKHGAGSSIPLNMCGVKNINAQETHCKSRENFQQQESINGPGKSMRMSNPSSSMPAHCSEDITQIKIGQDDGWFFKEGCTTAKINSGFGSFGQASGTKGSASSGCKLWTEDPLCDPILHVDSKLSFEKSSPDVSAECSPSGGFCSERVVFRQPMSHLHSYETVPSIISRSSKPNLSADPSMQFRPRETFHVGIRRDNKFSTIAVQGIVGKDREKKSGFLPTDCDDSELQEDIYRGSDGFSSENAIAINASDSEDKGSHSKEPKDKTPEIMESPKATSSPQHAEEISSSVEITDKFAGGTGENEYQHDTRTSLPSQNWCQGNEAIEKKNNADTSFQVMMLESYVLQLLCVQVLKEASVQGTGKKV